MKTLNKWILLFLALIGVLSLLLSAKLTSSHKAERVKRVELELSKEQQMLLNEIKSEKADFVRIVNDAKTLTAAGQLDPNVGVKWFVAPDITGLVTTGTTNNILYGFRHDGLIIWKNNRQ